MFYSPKTDADPQSTCVFPTEALKNQPAMSPQKVLAEISQSIPIYPSFYCKGHLCMTSSFVAGQTPIELLVISCYIRILTES